MKLKLASPATYILGRSLTFWDPHVILPVYCKGLSCVFIQIHVETFGYVGFGLSPHGKMEDSDVIIFLVDSDGNAEFTVSTNIRLHDFRNLLKKGSVFQNVDVFP